MFSAAKIKADRGKGKEFFFNHLSCNDYFSEHNHVEGHWKGELSKVFGLENCAVTSDVFSCFQQNLNPVTKGKLTQRTKDNSIRFYDFECSAQKSVSIMALFDPRLNKAHERAVEQGMKALEELAAVRIRRGENVKTNNYEFTKNFVYAQYHHENSRLLDPQLHTHNVIVNVTRTPQGDYKALETHEMYSAIRYAGKAYQNALACECRRLGYDLVFKQDDKGQRTGFELAGVSDEIQERCAKRRAQIEKKIAEFEDNHGRKPTPAERQVMSLDTRSAKLVNASEVDVHEHKMRLFSSAETETFKRLAQVAQKHTVFRPPAPPSHNLIAERIEIVSQQLFERFGVLRRDKVLAEVLSQNLGQYSLPDIRVALNKTSLVFLGGAESNPYFSTPENIEFEDYVCESIDAQKDLLEPIAPTYHAFLEPDGFDHTAQKQVISGILQSKDRFLVLRGVAGAGKTSILQELCKGLKTGGYENIHVIAPTTGAVDVLCVDGFDSSETVAKFLISKKPPRGSYLIVDESGLSSLRVGKELIDIALREDYRILFVGDEKQHKSIEFGDFFRLIEQHTDITKFELNQIYRQQTDEYRNAVALAAAGKVKSSFAAFDEAGMIYEGGKKYLTQAAQSFMDLTENGKKPFDCIAVSPTHDECDHLTVLLRSMMRERGYLPLEEELSRSFVSWNWTKQELGDLSRYKPGMQVFFTRQCHEVAAPGEMFEVSRVEDGFLHFTNGKKLYHKNLVNYVSVGENKPIALAHGDLIRFTCNAKVTGVVDQNGVIREKKFKLINGDRAMIGDKPGEVILFNSKREKIANVQLPSGFSGFRYGWVSTSHASQGKTSPNVVVAAQKMDSQAFYVSLSRGKFAARLHVPEKDFFCEELLRTKVDRLTVKDLVADGKIASPILSVVETRRRNWADRSYLSPETRIENFMSRVSAVSKKSWSFVKRAVVLKMRERIAADVNRHRFDEVKQNGAEKRNSRIER